MKNHTKKICLSTSKLDMIKTALQGAFTAIEGTRRGWDEIPYQPIIDDIISAMEELGGEIDKSINQNKIRKI